MRLCSRTARDQYKWLTRWYIRFSLRREDCSYLKNEFMLRARIQKLRRKMGELDRVEPETRRVQLQKTGADHRSVIQIATPLQTGCKNNPLCQFSNDIRDITRLVHALLLMDYDGDRR